MQAVTPVRVRFAPSPTGFLHVGGARTALFNYLFARRMRGQFFLRIEDTDSIRSDPEMTEAILRSLKWLGLTWDEVPVHQSTRLKQHRQACQSLLDSGHAYRCFCSVDELQMKRELAIQQTGEYRYDGTCRDLSESVIQSNLEANRPFTVRLRVPEGETVFHDGVRGDVRVNHREIGDFIVVRSDGSPVYQMAVVVDDHDMGITHVIRGDDHISNTPKQILLFQALDWDLPQFAHVPMILGSDKKRLSKRHGATSVEAFKEAGFLPQAVVNYLALLGWSPGDDLEIMSLNEMAEAFSLKRINKAAAVWDMDKLTWMNGQYLNRMSVDALLDDVIPLLIAHKLIDAEFARLNREFLVRFIQLMKERVRTLAEFAEKGWYFFRDPEVYDEKAVKKHWMKPGALENLKRLLSAIEVLPDWSISSMETAVHDLSEQSGAGLGKILQPARLAVTGSTASPGMFELMEALGREITIRRLRQSINYIMQLHSERH